MQCRKHHVASQRSFYAHGNRLFVTRLSDHDDVWVSPQKGAHHQRKVDSCFFVDLDLAQAFLGDFDRIFSRPDFGVRLVQKF